MTTKRRVAIAVELERSARNTAITVYDMLGSRLRSVRLAPAQSRIDLEVQDMAPGVYFATIEQGGRAIATRRFVVTH